MLNRVVVRVSNLKLAGCAAVALHLSLFYIELNRLPTIAPTNRLIPLNVVVQEVRDEQALKQTLKEQEPQITQESDLEPEETQQIPAHKEEAVIVSQTTEEKEDSIHVPSIHSKNFKNFLRLENESSLQANAEQVDIFNQSFEAPAVGTTPEKTHERILARHLSRVGVGMTEDEKGRRTCYALIHNMLDISAGPSVLSRDCTPAKKFELNRELN